jgi:DNA-binding MarR family transcriptional regulator
VVSEGDVKEMFTGMLAELDGEFESRWLSEFAPLQRRVLRVLAELGEAGVTEVAERLEVKPSDISSTLTRLREAMVIGLGDGSYRIVDTVFARWLTAA